MKKAIYLILAVLIFPQNLMADFGVGSRGNPPRSETIKSDGDCNVMLIIADTRTYKKDLLEEELQTIKNAKEIWQKEGRKPSLIFVYRGRPGHTFTHEINVAHSLVKSAVYTPLKIGGDPFGPTRDCEVNLFRNSKIVQDSNEISAGKLGLEMRMKANLLDIEEKYPKRSHVVFLEIKPMTKALKEARRKAREAKHPPKGEAQRVKPSCILVRGLGNVWYDAILKNVDLLAYCHNYIPEAERLRRKPIKVNLYIAGSKIVHIVRNKNKYPPTEDLSTRALRTIQYGEKSTLPGANDGAGSGSDCSMFPCEPSWLDVGDSKKLATIWKYMQSSGWDLGSMEAELTPVLIRHGQSFRGVVKNRGKIFYGIYVRSCSGTIGKDYAGIRRKRGHPDKDTFLRKWSLVGFTKDDDWNWKREHGVGGGVQYPEATLRAIEKWKPFHEEMELKQRREKEKTINPK